MYRNPSVRQRSCVSILLRRLALLLRQRTLDLSTRQHKEGQRYKRSGRPRGKEECRMPHDVHPNNCSSLVRQCKAYVSRLWTLSCETLKSAAHFRDSCARQALLTWSPRPFVPELPQALEHPTRWAAHQAAGVLTGVCNLNPVS